MLARLLNNELHGAFSTADGRAPAKSSVILFFRWAARIRNQKLKRAAASCPNTPNDRTRQPALPATRSRSQPADGVRIRAFQDRGRGLRWLRRRRGNGRDWVNRWNGRDWDNRWDGRGRNNCVLWETFAKLPMAIARGQQPEGGNAKLLAACLMHSIANWGLPPEGLGWRPKTNYLGVFGTGCQTKLKTIFA